MQAEKRRVLAAEAAMLSSFSAALGEALHGQSAARCQELLADILAAHAGKGGGSTSSTPRTPIIAGAAGPATGSADSKTPGAIVHSLRTPPPARPSILAAGNGGVVGAGSPVGGKGELGDGVAGGGKVGTADIFRISPAARVGGEARGSPITSPRKAATSPRPQSSPSHLPSMGGGARISADKYGHGLYSPTNGSAPVA